MGDVIEKAWTCRSFWRLSRRCGAFRVSGMSEGDGHMGAGLAWAWGVCTRSRIWYLAMYPCPSLLVPPKRVDSATIFGGTVV